MSFCKTPVLQGGKEERMKGAEGNEEGEGAEENEKGEEGTKGGSSVLTKGKK